jgi:hypothetical protein
LSVAPENGVPSLQTALTEGVVAAGAAGAGVCANAEEVTKAAPIANIRNEFFMADPDRDTKLRAFVFNVPRTQKDDEKSAHLAHLQLPIHGYLAFTRDKITPHSSISVRV